MFDSAFRIPGTRVRFGLDPILGLVPGIGDLASPALTLLILLHAARARVPKIVLARMVINSGIDAIGGVLPIIGDAFDVVWKANDWNLALLERHATPGRPPTSGDYLFVILCVIAVVVTAIVPLLAAAALFYWAGRELRGVPLV